MHVSFSDKVTLVAGGTGGLGTAVSLAFVDEGARVIVPYHTDEEFASLKNAAGANGSALEGYPVDVTDEDATATLIDRVLLQHGRLDAAVNAVGGYAGGMKMWELPTKDFDRMLSLNLRSGYALARAALPAMLKQRHGAIVNIAAKAALDHSAGLAAYAASKAAALALMDALAADAKGTGVRVNSVLPSIIDTEANREAMPNADFTEWPKPQDIARVVLFLCSDEAKAIHGAAIPVYGNN
jgi:NAD(P)-dependent dehydrogenase (short-subunit alcohol dehydrogenase family)